MKEKFGSGPATFRTDVTQIDQGIMENPNSITFVVTCKGRLHHLRQSLPLLAIQPGCECTVVDYDCPDQTHLWVAEHFPAVRVVRVGDAPRFNVAHARNLGAAAATTPWLCFVDADVLIAEHFSATLAPLLRQGFYFRPQPLTWEKWGTHLCPRAAFLRAEGYDEVMEGWGNEDDDLYHRFAAMGCQPANFPGELITSIQHGDEDRTRHHDIRGKWANQRINALYLHIKYDLARQLGTPNLALQARQALYSEVRGAMLQETARGAAGYHFEVILPNYADITLEPGYAIRRRLVYDMTPQSGLAPMKSPPAG